MSSIEIRRVTLRVLIITPWFPENREDQMGNFVLDSVEALGDLDCKIYVAVTSSIKFRDLKNFIISRLINKLKKNINSNETDIHCSFSNKIELKKIYHWSIPRNYFRSISNYLYRRTVATNLLEYVKKRKIDLIHAHTEIASLAAYDISRVLSIPWAVTLHGSNRAARLLNNITHKHEIGEALRSANRVFLVGNPIWKEFKDIAGTDSNFELLFNGVRMPDKNSPNKTILKVELVRFVSVSNLHKEKGIELTLSAFLKLKKAGFENWRYDVIGGGYQMDYLRQMAVKLNLTEHVFFHGALAHNRVMKILAISDVFVLPSYREAFGIVYLEAMINGLLTIAVDGQGASSFIWHNKTGLLVKSKSVSSLFDSLQRVFSDTKSLQEIAKNGQKEIENHYLWSNHAKKLVSIYQDVLVSKRHA